MYKMWRHKCFLYCDSLNDLKSLATFGVEDFIVTECYSFE